MKSPECSRLLILLHKSENHKDCSWKYCVCAKVSVYARGDRKILRALVINHFRNGPGSGLFPLLVVLNLQVTVLKSGLVAYIWYALIIHSKRICFLLTAKCDGSATHRSRIHQRTSDSINWMFTFYLCIICQRPRG